MSVSQNLQDGVNNAYIALSRLVALEKTVTEHVENDDPFLNESGVFDPVVWDDSMVPAIALRTQGTSDPAFEAWQTGIYAYNFSGSALNQVHGSVQLPHGYKVGSTLYPHIHWSPMTTGAGDVIWGLEYAIVTPTGTYGANDTIYTTAQAAGGTAKVHKIASFTTISGTNLDISSIMMFRLFRDPTASGDTYADKATLLGFDIHFQKDSLGSRTELTK